VGTAERPLLHIQRRGLPFNRTSPQCFASVITNRASNPGHHARHRVNGTEVVRIATIPCDYADPCDYAEMSGCAGAPGPGAGEETDGEAE
jgi:hypothetical protein